MAPGTTAGVELVFLSFKCLATLIKLSKPVKTCTPLQMPGHLNLYPNRHPKATAIASYGRSRLPFASPQTPQTLQIVFLSFKCLATLIKLSKPVKTCTSLQMPGHLNLYPNRHPKATAMAAYGRSRLLFASPQTIKTFQTLQTCQPPTP